MKQPKGAAKVARLERQGITDRAAEREAALKKVAANRELTRIRRAIYERDQCCCRVCKRVVAFDHHNPRERMEWHHIQYRSAGGPSTVENGLTLCWKCHRFEHEHRYRIVGTGAKVTITERNLTTGKVIREWESEAV